MNSEEKVIHPEVEVDRLDGSRHEIIGRVVNAMMEKECDNSDVAEFIRQAVKADTNILELVEVVGRWVTVAAPWVTMVASK